MTDKERITKLEERLARAEARVAELEARPYQQVVIQQQRWPVYPYQPWPAYPMVTYGDGTASPSTTYALNS